MEDGPPRFNRDFSCPDLLGNPDSPLPVFRLRDSHPLWSAVPGAFCYTFDSVTQGPTTPEGLTPPVWALPRSLAATWGISFDFFSSRYLDVSVPWVGSFRCWNMTPSGLPHSEIPGSTLACSSPRLIAACHVLHRRHVPRHPPCALYYLTRIYLRLSAPRFVGLRIRVGAAYKSTPPSAHLVRLANASEMLGI